MSKIHTAPEVHGVAFGNVVVTIDISLRDCVLHVSPPSDVGFSKRQVRLHSVDQVQASLQVQISNPKKSDPSMVQALKFAALQLNEGDSQ